MPYAKFTLSCRVRTNTGVMESFNHQYAARLSNNETCSQAILRVSNRAKTDFINRFHLPNNVRPTILEVRGGPFQNQGNATVV